MGFSFSSLVNPFQQGRGLDSINNPAKAIVDDSQTANPLRAFLDPFDALGGLVNGMPGLAPLPKMPSWAVKYLAFRTTKTNFGAFTTKSMQDVPNSIHASIWEKPVAPPAAPSAPTVPPNPGGHAPPVDPAPVNPGGPGIGIQPQSRIFSAPDPARTMATHYAKTPNLVVSRSAMTAPVVTGSSAPGRGVAPAGAMR